MKKRKILLATPRGFCAGVVRAIEIVERALQMFPPPVYVFHEIVHNRYVVEKLRRQNAIFVKGLEEVPPGSICIFSAHGVSPEIRHQAVSRNLQVIDATCPLVTKVHMEAIRYTREGYSLILIGHPGHEEVEGTMGEARMALVSSVEDVNNLNIPNPDKLIYLTQTTLSLDDTKHIVSALRRKFPNLKSPPKDDICYATQNRQNAVKEIMSRVDLMLVVGSQNSSNSQRLKEVSTAAGVPAYLINDELEIRSEWLENVTVIGVTAGASAPEEFILRVTDYLCSLGPTEVEEVTVADEDIHFSIPEQLSGASPSITNPGDFA